MNFPVGSRRLAPAAKGVCSASTKIICESPFARLSGIKNRCTGEDYMLSARSLAVGVSTLGLVVAMATVGYAVDITKVKLYPDKKGTVADLQPMSKFCGTKPIKVALADGWGGNYWRHITRAEFEDEASKCKNITDARYTDAEFKPEKHIADIEGLIAQKYDVIVAFLDGGPAILKAGREATGAGVAFVPYDTGDKFPGVIGKDYLDRATESQSEVGQQAAEWLVKTLGGKGNIIMFGGTPGTPMTEAQTHGWRPVFAKYPQIDGIDSETVGPSGAFVAAGKPIPAYVGQALMDLSCITAEHPEMKMMSIDAHTWMVRLALRKAVAAAQGIDNDEPSLITLPIVEDTTSKDPKLALKCDKSMPMDSIPGSMLTNDQQKKALGK